MFDMMLGPIGTSYWVGPNAMPQARFHHDWSRIAVGAALLGVPFDAFSYGIGTQNPAAITAAIGATPANYWDTSISKADALSKDCLATHFGVEMQNVCEFVGGADVVNTLANYRILYHNMLIQVFYGERTNEECAGFLEDFPSGLGSWMFDYGAAFNGISNGVPLFTNVKPLPQPLACKGGDTYFRVTFTPKTRANGTTPAVVTSFVAHVYGVSPARRPPVEAHANAMQALVQAR